MIAYQLLQYLENQGFGTDGVDLFCDFMPDSPENNITLYNEQAASLPESDSLAIDRFGLQVMVRNSNSNTAMEKIMQIHRLITGFGGESLIAGGNIVSYITLETSPFSLGKDEKGLNKWTGHYNIRVQSINDKYRD